MLRYLLDTNIVIYVLKRRPVEVLSTFNANASRMAMSSITLAELLHGAEKSSRVSENLAAIEDFCSRLEVLPYGPKAAQHYGAIRAALEKLGQPIGLNDMHIAAHARGEGLVLVTNNTERFARVPALEVENWVHTAQ
jgi:tRNA(fMet)-specific endonuclease VapC